MHTLVQSVTSQQQFIESTLCENMETTKHEEKFDHHWDNTISDAQLVEFAKKAEETGANSYAEDKNHWNDTIRDLMATLESTYINGPVQKVNC